jgi:hypothetical protein
LAERYVGSLLLVGERKDDLFEEAERFVDVHRLRTDLGGSVGMKGRRREVAETERRAEGRHGISRCIATHTSHDLRNESKPPPPPLPFPTFTHIHS